MAKVKVELNSAGIQELLKGSAMQGVLISYASQIANAAGDGYSVHVGPKRANVSIRTDTEEAYNDNLENNTLEKATRS